MAKTGRIQSIDRAVLILKCFNERNKELSLSDISEKLDINKSTIHGILSTLRYHGLIDQDNQTQKYKLGLGLMQLGATVSNSLDINHVSGKQLDYICSELNETVHMCILDGKDVVYIDKKESAQSIRIITNIGSRIPAYCTGVGKAILAFTDKNKLNEHIPAVFEKMTNNTITDRKLFMEELHRIRMNGIAIDDEEYVDGLYCVAAPIFDRDGKVKYAISTSGPIVRMTSKKVEYAKKLILEAAMVISKDLGYQDRCKVI